MEWLFYTIVFSAILWRVPFNEIAPHSTAAFDRFLVAVKNETLECLGFHYSVFYKALEMEREKYKKDMKKMG